jgi:hypothetical protein
VAQLHDKYMLMVTMMMMMTKRKPQGADLGVVQ